MFTDQDYSITVVPTGAEGVQQILAGDFDAILCDMVMPNFPGDMFYLAVQRIRRTLPAVHFHDGAQRQPKGRRFHPAVGLPGAVEAF